MSEEKLQWGVGQVLTLNATSKLYWVTVEPLFEDEGRAEREVAALNRMVNGPAAFIKVVENFIETAYDKDTDITTLVLAWLAVRAQLRKASDA